jgi:hypothetical protein
MLKKAGTNLNLLVERSQAYVAIENHTVKVIWFKIRCHLYAAPVFCPTTVGFKHVNFVLVQ